MGVLGGALGVGGPVVAVPILVVLGIPLLEAVAMAQVQSVFLSLFATVGYLTVGAVEWSLALLVAVPQLVGVVAGWRLAHRVPTSTLRDGLAVVLVAVGALLAV